MSRRRIPTKTELLRLQKLYRTDRKIADVLGVTEHLVSYWRRKKGIAQYAFPKFSEKEIREVWHRFGDDFHAGMELGISKAAFYNWRRRYKITRKPDALKLEQLSLQLYTDDRKDRRRIGTGRQTILQKCLARKIGDKDLPPGKEIEFEPDVIIAAGNTNEVFGHFQKSGIRFVKNPGRIIVSLDGELHDATHRKAVRDFTRLQQIQNFFDIGEGDVIQLALERGLILPGQIIVGSNRWETACGCLGAAGIRAGAEGMAGLWAEGTVKFKIPETVRLIITGRLPRTVFVRDVIHHVIAEADGKGFEGRQVEFYGPAIEQMTISERFTLCRMMLTAGASGAVCPFDATARRYVSPRARRPFTPILADRNAIYINEFTFDVNTMKPVAAGPDDVRKIASVDELAGIQIQQVFLGGAANGRFDDLKIAADILKGKQINSETRLVIQPASRQVYLEALKKGLIRVFIEAGAVVVCPGTLRGDACLVAVAVGETALITYQRMPSAGSGGHLYQVSPATAAASALTGQITNPGGYLKL